MASPNSVFTELSVTTFKKHRKEIIDNISNRNALLAALNKRGNVRVEDGGYSIVEPLEYAENGTYQRYSGYDTLNISASEVISAAEFQWRNVAVNVVASGTEMRTNSGDTKLINLVKSRVKNAIHTFKNNFSSDLYSDGSLANQITGLQAMVADNQVGTIGNINATNFTFWKNKLQSAAAPIQGGGAITPSAVAGVMDSLMLPLYLQLSKGGDTPDLIIADDNYYTFYENSQVGYRRYTSDDGTANSGFTKLRYKNAEVLADGGSGITSNHMYMLNTSYLHLVVHRDANMTPMEEMKPYNQDAIVIPILWMGNLTCSNRSMQGVMKA